MKYARLTKEQFETLAQEFSTFLATQSIDKAEWEAIKTNKPEVAEQELDIFSDLIWEKVLTNATFLEHFSKNHIFLFQCFDTYIETIILKSKLKSVDFLNKEGLHWLSDNLFTPNIEMKTGRKVFSEARNISIFQLIQQGAILNDGDLYKKIDAILKQK
jgi:Family of unknown function (DUF6495)